MGNGRNDGDWRDRDRSQRYDEPRGSRDGGSRDSGGRGFFERAGDEISSWFGDDEAERRREMDERSGRGRDRGRDDYRDQDRRPMARDNHRPADRDDYRRAPMSRDHSDYDRGRQDTDRSQAYRPLTGDYSRAASERYERPSSERYEREPSRAVGYAGAAASGVTAAHDRHYGEWRQRQIDELDRDYDDYRREHQSKLESDFSNWRSTRQSKRQMLGTIKEHMQVVGADEQPLGTVDKVRGDRLILTKADSPDGKHHSVNCAMIDRVEGDRVILDKPADAAKAMFGDEDRDRALFERDDQRQPGAHVLDRSFSGTY